MKINGLDAYVTYGLTLLIGADSQFLKLPQRKPGYEYSWPDENGIETDPNEVPKFERKIYSLPILIRGKGKIAFFTKYNALTTYLLSAKEFNLDVEHLNRRFKVRYSDMSAFDKRNMFTTNGLTGCTFTLVLTDDYPTSNFVIP